VDLITDESAQVLPHVTLERPGVSPGSFL